MAEREVWSTGADQPNGADFVDLDDGHLVISVWDRGEGAEMRLSRTDAEKLIAALVNWRDGYPTGS